MRYSQRGTRQHRRDRPRRSRGGAGPCRGSCLQDGLSPYHRDASAQQRDGDRGGRNDVASRGHVGMLDADASVRAKRFVDKPAKPAGSVLDPSRALVSMDICVIDWTWLKSVRSGCRKRGIPVITCCPWRSPRVSRRMMRRARCVLLARCAHSWRVAPSGAGHQRDTAAIRAADRSSTRCRGDLRRFADGTCGQHPAQPDAGRRIALVWRCFRTRSSPTSAPRERSIVTPMRNGFAGPSTVACWSRRRRSVLPVTRGAPTRETLAQPFRKSDTLEGEPIT